MAGRWTVTPVNSSTGARWHLMFTPRAARASHVATVDWLVRLDHPSIARDRVDAGLNGVLGPAQPPRCWTVATHPADTPHGPSWRLNHNGRECAWITWHHPPPVSPEIWQARLLAGLNLVPPNRHDPPPPSPQPART